MEAANWALLFLCLIGYTLAAKLDISSSSQNSTTGRSCPRRCNCTDSQLICEHTAIWALLPHFANKPLSQLILSDCYATTSSKLDQLLSASRNTLMSLRLEKCDMVDFTLDGVQFPRLRHVDLSGNYLTNLSSVLQSLQSATSVLQTVNLSSNSFQTVDILAPSFTLQLLNLSSNKIETVESLPKASVLDLSRNIITQFNGPFRTDGIAHLDLSFNRLQTLTNITAVQNLRLLNLSENLLREIDGQQMSKFKSLNTLDVSNNPLRSFNLSSNSLRSLQNLQMSNTKLRAFDFDSISYQNGFTQLKSVDLSRNSELHSVLGRVPRGVQSLDLSFCQLRYLPETLFDKAESLTDLSLAGNKISCEECALAWTTTLTKLDSATLPCNGTRIMSNFGDNNCSIGIDVPSGTIVRQIYGLDAFLHCGQYGTPPPSVTWSIVDSTSDIGTYHPASKSAYVQKEHRNNYDILPEGVLVVRSVSRAVVGRYKCRASNKHGERSTTVKLRLDLATWYSWQPFHSTFLGSIVCGIFTCIASFFLNVLWIVCRKVILWRILRAEETSRMRKMVEALEKYRQRQMINLHDQYQKRVVLLRDNYRQQVEQLRGSYTSQVERFRDYRADKMGSVTQHIDNIKDNYAQQKGRLRDYGSKRADQLWESYERQTNRIRTFTLQQRLRLMRQYKIKQKYLNKLLESLNMDPSLCGHAVSTEESKAVAASILAALDDATKDLPMAAATELLEICEEADEPLTRRDLYAMSTASSYHSLPDFFLKSDDEDFDAPCTSASGNASANKTTCTETSL